MFTIAPLSWGSVAALLAVQAPTVDPTTVPPQQYVAIRAQQSVRIDGTLDDPVWQRAPVSDAFTERQPELGSAPPVRTSLRVAYDDLALYVFIEAETTAPPMVRMLRRDAFEIWGDDSVTVKIDPRHDGRTAYAFGVNADGAQVDLLSLENGRLGIREWDAVWQCETTTNEHGFTAEYRIPFAAMGMRSAAEATMGLNVSRDMPRAGATYDWRLIVPPLNPMTATSFGELQGLKNLRGGRTLEYLPYALGRTRFRREFTLDPTQNPTAAVGGNVRLQTGDGSYVEASLLTDFAQVEADQVQVARNRFPLFFPERRPFFINGLGDFNFGLANEGQLFFSRKIGLRDGSMVPLLGGLKSYGRRDDVSYGVLHVQTLAVGPDGERGTEALPAESFSVGRIRVQATDHFNLGVIGMGNHRSGRDEEDSASGGFDAQWVAPDGRLQWYSFIAGTYAQTPAEPDDGRSALERRPEEKLGTSAATSLDYSGLYFRGNLNWLWSSRDFSPTMGFYRRISATRQIVRLFAAPRPRFLNLREIEFGPMADLETTEDYSDVLTARAGGNLRLNWRGGASAGYEYRAVRDEVLQAFPLYQHNVEAGRYNSQEHRANITTPQRFPVSGGGRYSHTLQFFGGTLDQFGGDIVARITKHAQIGLGYTHLLGDFGRPDTDFSFGFANGSAGFALNRNLTLDNLLRLNTAPEQERLGVQSRLRWRFAAGSDLFVVYRYDTPLQVDGPRNPFHELTVKFSYYLRAILPG